MNIQQNWQLLNEEIDPDFSSLLNHSAISRRSYLLPLEKIKNQVRISLLLIPVITCPYIILMILFPYWQLELALGVLVSFSCFCFVMSFRFYNSIQLILSTPGSILVELKRHYNTIIRHQKLSLRLGLFIWPVGMIAGKMVGHMIGSGEPISEYLLKTSSIIELIIFSIILIPLIYIVARAIAKGRYGNYLADLKKKISELEG